MSKRAQKEEKILQEFQTISKEMAPKPKYFKNIILAFIVGGIICTIGQFILNKIEQIEFVEVEELDSTERGEGGFGHTGK